MTSSPASAGPQPAPVRIRGLAAGVGRTLLRRRLYDQTKQMPYQAARRSGDVLLIKGLRVIAAGQWATAAVPHKVTGLAWDHRKGLAIKRIAGATLPSGCHICGSPRTKATATGQEASRATSAA